MRYFLILMLGFTMSAFPQNVTDEVGALKAALALEKPDAINQALIRLQGAINQYEFVDRSPWNNPSPEKQRRRVEIRSALQPIVPDLSRLVTAENPTLAANSAVILGFSGGDSAVYKSLKQSLQESPYSSVVSSSAYSMFQLGLADVPVRTAITERLQQYQSESKRDVAFGLLNLASAWPIPEALPVITEILNSNEQIGAKMVAINALIRLGPQAKEALPEIERILQELERQGGDFRDINTAKRAIMLVSGRGETPQPATSVATPVQSTPIPPSATLMQQPKSSPPDTPSPSVGETKSSPWLWIIGSILLLAVMGGILLKLRRK